MQIWHKKVQIWLISHCGWLTPPTWAADTPPHTGGWHPPSIFSILNGKFFCSELFKNFPKGKISKKNGIFHGMDCDCFLHQEKPPQVLHGAWRISEGQNWFSTKQESCNLLLLWKKTQIQRFSLKISSLIILI